MTAVLPADIASVHRLASRAVSAAEVGYPSGPAVALPPFTSAAAARAWLDAELPTLLALAGPGAGLRTGPALNLLGVALLRLGRPDEAAAVLARCVARCRDRGDRRGEAAALIDLGICRDHGGRHVEALAWYAEAYGLCLRIGWVAGQDAARQGLASLHRVGMAGSADRWSRPVR